MIIPHGESILLPNDSVFFLGLKDGINEVEQVMVSNHATFHKRAVTCRRWFIRSTNLAILLGKSGFTVKVT